jgi:DNA primase large subunit
MRELTTLARYPFLADTRQYIKDHGPTVPDLLRDLLYERARVTSIERLDHALKDSDVGERSLATEADCIMEILSYPLARMISVCINDPFFSRRYALGEAYHAYKYLLTEPTSFLATVAKELALDVTYTPETRLQLFFKDYLRYAPTTYKEWKMVNRELQTGYVTLSHKDLARVIQETLRARINTELESRACDETVITVFADDIHRLKTTLLQRHSRQDAVPVGKLHPEHLPPCMTDLLAATQAGENVPHMGRFALVAFLNSLKLSPTDILRLFSTAPDYEEEKTRYQVDHITGASSSTSYKCPGCDKMRTYGICPTEKMDGLCQRTRHPLNCYSAKWRQTKKP